MHTRVKDLSLRVKNSRCRSHDSVKNAICSFTNIIESNIVDVVVNAMWCRWLAQARISQPQHRAKFKLTCHKR